MVNPCENCAPFGGDWTETESGLRRCTCPRGRELKALDAARHAPPQRKVTPVISTESAAFATEALGAIPFFPGDQAARTMIGEEIQNMCRSEEDVLWLVRRMIRLYGDRWPGPAEMRRVYCNGRMPLDRVEAIGESQIYPDGIPSEHPENTTPQLGPGAGMKALPPGAVSAAPSVDRAVKALAAGKGIEPKPAPPVPLVPLVRPEKRITQADIDREVEALRNRRAKPELDGVA